MTRTDKTRRFSFAWMVSLFSLHVRMRQVIHPSNKAGREGRHRFCPNQKVQYGIGVKGLM